jgi:hypothetical protein
MLKSVHFRGKSYFKTPTEIENYITKGWSRQVHQPTKMDQNRFEAQFWPFGPVGQNPVIVEKKNT